jgi:hypothetical protein
MLVWANAHGGFLVGGILIALTLFIDAGIALLGPDRHVSLARVRLRQLAVPAAVTLCVTLLNPAGFGLWTHVTAYFGKSLLVNLTDEYRAPSLHDHSVRPFFALLGLLFAGFVYRRGRPGLYELALSGAFSFFALYSARNIPLFAIVVAPFVATSLERLDLRAQLGQRTATVMDRFAAWLSARGAAYSRLDARSAGHLWPALAMVALVGISVASSSSETLGVAFDSRRQPTAAVVALRESGVQGNLFNELHWGGYLLHELWPSHKVFIDGQTDFYGEDLTRTFLEVRDARPGWQSVLDQRDVRVVILPPDAPLVRELTRSASWRRLYEDATATVVVREAIL